MPDTQIWRDGRMQPWSEAEQEAIRKAQEPVPAPASISIANQASHDQQPVPVELTRAVDVMASSNTAPESPIAYMMAAVLNPSSVNLEKMVALFESYITKLPLPDYVKEGAKGFLDSLKRWAAEQKAAQ